jgi:NADH-quinone oxidoreductase subunit N
MDMGAMVMAILPELGLLLLAGVVLALDLAWRASRRWLGWVTAGGALLVLLLSVLFSRPEAATQAEPLFGGMLRLDATSFVFRLIFVCGAGLTALFAMHHEIIGNRGEFYALMLIGTLGMSLMAAAGDLILLFLAIETTSLPLYILAGFLTRDEKSVEAGIKYMLYGAVTSAVMLYGFSLLYGFTGTTNLYEIAGQLLPRAGAPLFGPVLALLLALVGFGFKISAAPFHFWAPDVYEGAPTPVTGFLSTASKAAGFVVPRLFGHLAGAAHRPGDRQYVHRQPAGPGAEEHQAPAGLFLHRPGWLHAYRRGGRIAAWAAGHHLLPDGLPADQPGGLRRDRSHQPGDRLG